MMKLFQFCTELYNLFFSKAIVKATEEMFNKVRKHLLPTPANAHCVFSYYDIARIISGCMLMSPRSKVKPKSRRVQLSSPEADMSSS